MREDGRVVYRYEHFFDNEMGCPCERGRRAQDLCERHGVTDALAETMLEWAWARKWCDNRNYRGCRLAAAHGEQGKSKGGNWVVPIAQGTRTVFGGGSIIEVGRQLNENEG